MLRRFRAASFDHEPEVGLDEVVVRNEYGAPEGTRSPGKWSRAAAVQLTRTRPGERPREFGGPAPVTHEVALNTVLVEPERARIDAVLAHIEAQLARANAIFAPHGIRVARVGRTQVVPGQEAERLLGIHEQDRRAELRRQGFDDASLERLRALGALSRTADLSRREFDASDVPEGQRQGDVNREERELLGRYRRPGMPTAYWVPSMRIESPGMTRTGQAYDTAAWRNLPGDHEGVVLVRDSALDDLAHELVHLLARAPHDDLAGHTGEDVPIENIAHPHPRDREGRPRGGSLTPAQVAAIRSSRYARPAGTPMRQAEQASTSASGPQAQRSSLAEAPEVDPADAHAFAAQGVSAGGGALPHLDAIQRSFGDHDVGGVSAHVGGDAARAAGALGARAYATGERIAFAEEPDLRLAAHEAAHVVQQRAGVSLDGGIGRRGDEHERHADEVADLVVRGERAWPALDRYARRAAPIQRQAIQRDPPRGRQDGLTGTVSRTYRLPPRRIPPTGQSRWGHLEIEGSFTGGIQRGPGGTQETYESVEISRDQQGASITAESRGRIADQIAPELGGLIEDDFELSGDRDGLQLTAGLRTRSVELGPLSADFRLNLIRTERGSLRLELPSATATVTTRAFTLALDDRTSVQGSAQLQVTWHPNWVEIGRRVAQWVGRQVVTQAGEVAATEGAVAGTAGAGTVAGAVAIPVVAAVVVMGTIIYSLLEAMEESVRRARATHYIREYAYRLAFGVFELGHAVPNHDPRPGQYGSWTDWARRAVREGRGDGWRALHGLDEGGRAALRGHWRTAPRFAAAIANEVAQRLEVPIGYSEGDFPVGAG